MSVEFRPVSAIPFRNIDERLEKYGIKVTRRGLVTALEGRHGILFASLDGESTHFENKFVDTDDVLDAIQTEYQIEIVGEDDPRFWGYSTWEGVYSAPRVAPKWIVVEGPDPTDMDFTISWLNAAKEAGLLWQNNPELNDLWDKLCSHNPFYIEDDKTVDVSSAAMVFVGKWLGSGAAFKWDFSCSRWLEHFLLMLFAGFFVQTGDRYQMTVPREIDIAKVRGDLEDGLKRMRQENLSQTDLFATLPQILAEVWEARLGQMNVASRMADRAVLLDDLALQQVDQTK